jgi:hypothetical protein
MTNLNDAGHACSDTHGTVARASLEADQLYVDAHAPGVGLEAPVWAGHKTPVTHAAGARRPAPTTTFVTPTQCLSARGN